MSEKYDFSGWATKNDIKCSDGRVIRRNAFKDCDGEIVPLVWNHQHNKAQNVIGHALLQNREDGVYMYGSLNDNDEAQAARRCLKNGDVRALSIYANQLKQHGGDVLHGVIREVSLVLAGANPGAKIDSVMIHSEISEDEGYFYCEEVDDIRLYHGCDKNTDVDDDEEDEDDALEHKKETVADVYEGMTDIQKKAVYAIVNQALSEQAAKMKHSDTNDELEHAESGDEKKEPEMKEEPEKEAPKGNGPTVKEVFDTFTDKQKKVLYALIAMALEKAKESPEVKHSDEEIEELVLEHADGEETIGDVFDTFTEDQKTVAYALIGQAIQNEKKNKGEADKSENEKEDKQSEGGSTMKHNVFDTDVENGEVLTHSEMVETFNEINEEAKKTGSMRSAFLAHGIQDIGTLFPDAKNIENMPRTINQRTGWVPKVMDNVHHTPFARIKSLFADIREDDARAKGYIKGNRKYEEVIIALKRVTTPTTIYKKQALDRDDYVDITDFDVVAFLKNEMRGKLDEEIAIAILTGDGRSAASPDKVNEQNIRPIWTDDDLFTVKKVINVPGNATADQKARAWIRETVKARKEYRGSGNPTMFCSEDMLADALLIEDTLGRRLYNTEAELCSAMRVKEIVSVPAFENKTRIVNGTTHILAGIMVNLADYNVGTDKHGTVNMFDDFDIDYNQMKYLMEGRMSGAMTVPYGAVALEIVYSLMLDIDAIAPGTTILGKNTNDLQSDIVVNDTSISGTLKYVTGYTGYSGDPAEQSGNFLALEYDVTDGATTTIELIGGTTGVVTLDADKQSVTRVTNKNTQKLRVITTKGNDTVTRVLSLRTLTCLNA